jgi:hypothetical protein
MRPLSTYISIRLLYDVLYCTYRYYPNNFTPFPPLRNGGRIVGPLVGVTSNHFPVSGPPVARNGLNKVSRNENYRG